MALPRPIRTAAIVSACTARLLIDGRAVEAQLRDPATLYKSACLACHSDDGSGRVRPTTLTRRPPDFSDCRIATAERDADWASAIALGGPAVGRSSQMPSFADALSAEEIVALVARLRTFCGERGWPSGNLDVPRPLVTAKAFPEDEVVMVPTASHTRDERWRTSLIMTYARRLGKRAAIETALPFLRVPWLDGHRTGVGDIGLAATYVLHASEHGTRIVAGGFEVRLPTGSRQWTFGEGTTRLEPFVTAARAGRVWSVQSELRLELPAKYRTLERDERNRHIIYNIYAGRDGSLAANTWTAGVEFNGIDNRLVITPQIRKGLTRSGALAAAAGVRLPVVNSFLVQSTDVIGYLQWAYREPLRKRR